MAARLLPARLDGFAGGHRWGLWGAPTPQGPRMGAVLAVQACLDEQALSRRMLAHAARCMAEAGWWTLAIDPFGTGDSAGDHGEASLERWHADLCEAARRLRAQAPDGPLVLLGVRLGALIAIDLARRLPQPPQGLVLWSPPARGAALLDPLRHLARLGQRENDGRERGQTDEAGLAADPLRLAGWSIAPDLLAGLRGLRLDAAPAPGSPGAGIHLIQTQRLAVEGPEPPVPPPAFASALAVWDRQGWQTRYASVVGEPWWSAMDPVDPASLTACTLAALEGIAATAPRPPTEALSVTAPLLPEGCAAPACSPAALTIPGSQGALHGVLTASEDRARAALLIVPGQPQTRVGAHRMFVTLAAGLRARGIASLRVDLAGWGDSAGVAGPFETSTTDIVAAAAALRARVPDGPLWLYGLCDGASALALALPGLHDAGLRVQGVALLNPWVRSEATLASAMIGSYYRQRLLDPALWRRLLRGQVPLRHWLVDPLRHLARRLAQRPGSPGAAAHPQTSPPSLPQALIAALEPFEGEVLTLLAGADLTAAETEALLAADPRWRTRLDRPGCMLRLAGADHTLSEPATERAAIDWLAERITERARRGA